MNSRDGVSREFRFRITDKDTGERTSYTFSFKHQALEKKRVEKWKTVEDIGGFLKQKFQHLHYFFRIDWSQLLVGEDADKYKAVDQAEKDGHIIHLQPHIDVVKSFKVFSMKDSDGKREVEFSQIINHRNSPGNKGTVVVYKTCEPAFEWNIVDPSNQPTVSNISHEEFIGLVF